MYAAELYRLTKDGTSFTNWLGDITIERRYVGDVTFPTGEVVAFDPYYPLETDLPFSEVVPSGRYPLVLCVAHFKQSPIRWNHDRTESWKNPDQRVAAAILEISPQVPVRWEMATTSEQDMGVLEEGEVFGYSVDSGTGSLMDIAAKAILQRQYEEDDYRYSDYLDETMDENWVPSWSWAIPVVEQASGLNCAIFISGLGDGTYASYWGYDEVGSVICLMTDFGILMRR